VSVSSTASLLVGQLSFRAEGEKSCFFSLEKCQISRSARDER
jgi:hypothetical protein